MKFDTILAATDFSPTALAATRHACRLAGAGKVRLLHVVSTELLYYDRLSTRAIRFLSEDVGPPSPSRSAPSREPR